MSLEQENYARDADIIVSSWFIITHQSLPKLFILAGPEGDYCLSYDAAKFPVVSFK
jgi:hypothetical protein